MKSKLLLMLILASCLCPLRLSAQLFASPSRLLSKDALLLIEIPNAESFLLDLKACWYDNCYGRSVESRLMKPFDLPAIMASFSAQERDGHWLEDTILSLRTKKSGIGKRLEKVVGSFVEDEFQHDDKREQKICELLAGMFPGRMFIGIEDREPTFSVVFGFEYDPGTFDWHQELLASASAQSHDSPVANIGEINIYELKNESIFFFSKENVIYGASSLESCQILLKNVEDLPEKEDSLAASRYFQRVASMLSYDDPNFDLICFARTEELLSKEISVLDGTEK